MGHQNTIPARSDAGSITLELHRVRKGDHPTTRRLFDLWFERLSRIGRRLLSEREQRVVGGEDLAQVVLANFFCALEAGFTDRNGNPIPIHSRLDVWRMLTFRLRKRALNIRRDENAECRGEGHVRGESAFMSRGETGRHCGIDQIADRSVAVLEEGIESLHRELISAFSRNGLRQIAELTLEGNSPAEIADQLGISSSTVYRKLNLIQQHWANLNRIRP